jgi:hypothetical protein
MGNQSDLDPHHLSPVQHIQQPAIRAFYMLAVGVVVDNAIRYEDIFMYFFLVTDIL